VPAAGVSEKPGRRGRRGRFRLGRIVRRLLAIAAAIVFLPYVVVPLYAVVNPPVTPLMLQNAILHGSGIHKTWVSLDAVSPNVVRAVLAAEDARFCSHNGIDWIEVRNAMNDPDGEMRGASTITMQTARNLFFFGGRSWLRKGFEAPLALYADFILSKPRILELYLNIAEWGSGVYGVAEASQRNFGVPPSKLSARQAALLAAALPSPERRDPSDPSRGVARIARLIAGRAAQLGSADDCVLG
jgi:monofunctional biosynthetic peptidoglycan transglycosylase